MLTAKHILFLLINLTLLRTQAAIRIKMTPTKDKNLVQSQNFKKETKNYLLDKTITIAIIDTGVDISHPYLKNFIWNNSGEMGTDKNGKDKRYNHIDDDGNGFIDDIEGWNFSQNNNDVFDYHGHGTHISGIIKKNIMNFEKVKILPIKYYSLNQNTEDNLKNSIAAINYAVKMKVDIINYSGGGAGFSEEEYHALQLAEENNILIIAAAGNESSNLNLNSYYPASYGLKNIFVIGSKNKKGEKSIFSNFGKGKVDSYLVGEDISSTLPNSNFGKMSGTSQATAIATAKVANSIISLFSQMNTQLHQKDSKNQKTFINLNNSNVKDFANNRRILIDRKNIISALNY